ncbi:hypothetical protein RND71_011644 [Anisodus tanguticus]|uniref:Uncharacterized protein n=1 Tax=Anisodus tanguticus TaxID=243964 RepID=A0AAE1VG95_9SOLA|nr:hypothetical protein RND71_011644 [Anisodus tanguticus]
MIRTDMYSCPKTGVELEVLDFIESFVTMGEIPILYFPSFQCCLNIQKVHLPIDLSVIDNTPVQSHVGIILGASYIISLALSILDYPAKPKLNATFFYVLGGVLHSFDQSLLCSSNQFPPVAFNLLVDGYLVKLGFLLELDASTAGIVGPLLMLLPFLFMLQRFEAYVGVLLLQMTLIGFTNVGHKLAFLKKQGKCI